MRLWEDFRQNRIPKFFRKKIAIFTRRVPVENVKTLKTWLWVFTATDNLKNLKLHHIDYEPNMSLWDDFKQNRRPKIFSEKIAIFPRRGAGKTAPHRLRPQYESVRRVQLKSKTKIFSEKIAIFPKRGAGKTCKTLKIWLWAFSAIDILRNVKLHDIDYGPDMSLWDDFKQNRRPKIFSKKIAIFTRGVPVENVKTLKTW